MMKAQQLFNSNEFYLDEKVINRINIEKIKKVEIIDISVHKLYKSLDKRIVPLFDTPIYKYIVNKNKKDATDKYNEYLNNNSRTDENHNIAEYDKLINDFSNYDIKEGIIVVDNYNIMIDGTHRASILLSKTKKNEKIKVLKIYYKGIHLKTIIKLILCKIKYLFIREV